MNSISLNSYLQLDLLRWLRSTTNFSVSHKIFHLIWQLKIHLSSHKCLNTMLDFLWRGYSRQSEVGNAMFSSLFCLPNHSSPSFYGWKSSPGFFSSFFPVPYFYFTSSSDFHLEEPNWFSESIEFTSPRLPRCSLCRYVNLPSCL